MCTKHEINQVVQKLNKHTLEVREMKRQIELPYVLKIRESCVYVDNISLCVESKSSDSMEGILVDEI